VTVTIADDTIVFDFSESDDQRPGTVNAVEAVTVSAVAFAIRSVTDPTIPASGGALRPVRVLTRPGSIVSARPPVAVGAGNVEVSQRVADVCLGALAAAAPARVGAASQGTMNNTLVGGNGWVYYETVGGGQGGRPGPRPGMSGVHTAMTNTQDTPVEALERAYAMRVRRYGLRRGSGGRGLAPGGDGIVRELEMLEAVTVSLVTERRMSRPWGLAGGAPGASGENWLLHEADEARAERLPDKCTIRMDPGDVVRVLTPGGGGWGIDPFVAGLDAYDARTPEEARDRDRVRTLADTSDPFSRDTALHLTGSAVVVHPPTRRVLLRWHVRMQGWLQVGGHGDAGERDPFVVARREAREETGLTDLRSWPPAARPAVVHVVVVPVPAWRGDPAHEHADVRYVFATDEPDAAIPESIGTPLRWLDIDAAIAEVRDNLRVTLERVRALLDTDVS
jgi:8-oxo-dGTP pyrophosphatase MutT (NUDIX family)